MSKQLDGKRVAILATDGFEESELAVPQSTLRSYGVEVHVIAPSKDGIRAWAETDWGDTYEVDKALDQAQPEDYHALVLPGEESAVPLAGCDGLVLAASGGSHDHESGKLVGIGAQSVE